VITAEATVKVVNTQRSYARALAKMQRSIFPTLTDEELLHEEHYLKHLELFPEGQFTGLVYQHGDWTPAGSTSTFLTTWETAKKPHTFLEAIDNGWLTKHNPDGDWLYGADMSVGPNFRRMGIASKLYEARKNLARRLNLRGEVAGGMLPGYHLHRERMSIERYVEKVVAGELTDPTLTAQLRNGFQVKAILYDHITDPRSDNCAALIVRPNPYYDPHRRASRV
jgi:GNAT superfamily N-acetyltransferase